MSIVAQKRCSKCGEWKDKSQFYKCKAKKDGLNIYCRDCVLSGAIAYYHSHADEMRAARKERYYRDPETERAKGIEYYWRDPERAKAYRREYIKAHPEINRQNVKNRKAKLRGVGGSFTAQEWEDLKGKYNHTCLRCGRSEPEITLTRDHIKPVELGGTNSIDNIQPLCMSCNSSKKKQEIDYRWR